MRTLLIVDDERNIRLGVKAIVDREYGSRYETMTASDGTEALAMIESRRIDIVITDIRMPEMDGLTLIRKTSEAGHRPAVIILSGYDDFNYAREAIQHDVKEYLLKPIVREELYRALERVEEELARGEQTAALHRAAERYKADVAASVFGYLLVEDAPNEAALDRAEAAGLTEMLAPSYAVGVLKTQQADGLSRVKAEEWLRRRTSEGLGAIWTADRDGQLVVASPDTACFAGLLRHLTDPQTPPHYIGVSRPAESPAQLHDRYRQAKQALRQSLLLTHTRSVLLHALPDPADGSAAPDGKSAPRPAVPTEEVRKLANMLGTGREEEMKAQLQRLFDLRTVEEGGIVYLEELARQLNELVFDEVFRMYGEESVEVLKLYKKVGNLDHYDGLSSYYRDVENLVQLLSDYIRSLKSAYGEHKEMRKAVQYIRDHYWKDLNMAMVSNHVSLNYSYFGQVFKEYTGESFVAYLRRIRIEKAKELLVHSDAKVYEIGARVGFDNVKHFNRVFKEMEGITAMEYRTRHGMPEGS